MLVHAHVSKLTLETREVRPLTENQQLPRLRWIRASSDARRLEAKRVPKVRGARLAAKVSTSNRSEGKIVTRINGLSIVLGGKSWCCQHYAPTKMRQIQRCCRKLPDPSHVAYVTL